MSSAAKKKHVRFASVEEEEEDNDEQEEDTLFEQRDAAAEARRGGGGLRSALKAATRSAGTERAEAGGGGGGGGGGRAAGHAACGRWIVTLALCASFLGLGMSISVLGPTFEELAINVKKNISNISYIFVGRSGGYIGGSLLGGLLFDCMDPHVLLGFSMLLTAFGMCAIPFCREALLLSGLMASIGISMGVLDTGGNVLILQTWGEQSGPHMQALHFSFAAGAFVSPIIAKLLFGHNNNDSSFSLSSSSLSSSLSSKVVTPPPNSTAAALVPSGGGGSGSLSSMWAYIVIGCFVLLVSLLFFGLWLRSGAGCGGARGAAETAAAKPRLARHHTALVALLCLFFFAYVGAEVSYGSFIFTFARELGGMRPAQAAGLNSLFWGSFAACRGAAILLAACVFPGTLLLLSLLGSTLASLLLCLLGRQTAALWPLTALYGAALATTFPSGVSWLEQYTTVTGRTAAALVVGAALGEMVLPASLGFLLGKLPSQPLLMYQALLASLLTALLFPLMFRLATVRGGGRGVRAAAPRRTRSDDSEYRQALLDEEDEDEEEEGEKEEENEADQWNDADFEVIEMDEEAGLLGEASLATDLGAPSPSSPRGLQPEGAASLAADSPRRKLLLSLDREKRD